MLLTVFCYKMILIVLYKGEFLCELDYNQVYSYDMGYITPLILHIILITTKELH